MVGPKLGNVGEAEGSFVGAVGSCVGSIVGGSVMLQTMSGTALIIKVAILRFLFVKS
jgi:hypothetical protein